VRKRERNNFGGILDGYQQESGIAMNKLFVFQNNDDPYKLELEAAYAISNVGKKKQLNIKRLDVDYLIKNQINVVIATELPKEWYFTLKGLDIVSIILGNREKNHKYADIAIDHLSKDDKRYFTGERYSLCQSNSEQVSEFNEIVNLILKLKWDSNFHGYNVAYLSCMHLTPNILCQIEKFIRRENIRLVEYLCNCHDRRSVLSAEENDFHFVDIRLSYRMKIQDKTHCSLGNFLFRKADEHDIPVLQAISKYIYKDSRYFFDNNFDREKVYEFYQGWVQKGVLGQYDDECWCLCDKDLPVAFCTVKYKDSKTAAIGLVGVDVDYQSNGLGKKTMYSMFNMLMDKGIQDVFVVTQGRNYPAQRLYQSVGLRTHATQLWYHKWI
jgi:ribosomal protein S18 acetylase RimI-like enzyme